jgi:hypothetical protein
MLSIGKEALIVNIYLSVLLETSITLKCVILQYNIVRPAAVLGG